MRHIELDQLEQNLERRTIRRRKRRHPAMKVNSRSVFGLVKTIKQRSTNKK